MIENKVIGCIQNQNTSFKVDTVYPTYLSIYLSTNWLTNYLVYLIYVYFIRVNKFVCVFFI